MKNIKKTLFFTFALSCMSTLFGQNPPNWLQSTDRERNYPNDVFITGYSTGNVRAGESKTDAAARLRKEAQAYIAEAIRVQVNSETQSHDTRTKTQNTGKEATEQINSIFEAAIKTSATIELAGIKTDSYYDETEKLVYGFACVNRYELTGFYKASLNMNLQQLESILNTAKQLEASSEKAKARTQYEETVSLLVKVEQAQDVLVALDKYTSLQRDKTAQYRSDIIQALARLKQGVYVYVENKEDLFGTKVDIVANKVKADLAANGCSFTEIIEQADFRLRINVTTRPSDKQEDFVFCYADVAIELYDIHKQKAVFNDEITQKGASTSLDKAGRKALNDAAQKITEKLKKWIQ